MWAGQQPSGAEVRSADTPYRVRELAVRSGCRLLDARSWPEDITATVRDTTVLPVDVASIADGISARRRELLGS